jgi:hypothetical protein
MGWRDWLERANYRWETVVDELRRAVRLPHDTDVEGVSPLVLEELEDRVLLSATPFPIEVVEAAADPNEAADPRGRDRHIEHLYCVGRATNAGQ